jgi:hypothetical protein
VYIKSSTRLNSLLNVDDNFATLIEVKSVNQQQAAKFEFSFKISQIEALKENAFSVLITVKKPSTLVEPKIVPQDRLGTSTISAGSIVENILSHKIKLSNINKKNQNDVVATKVADITSKINNHIINIVKNGEDVSNKGLEKTKIIVSSKQSNELTGNFLKPLKTTQIENPASIEDRSTRLKLLKQYSISPANVSLLSSKTVTAFSSLTGIYRKDDRINKNLFLDQLSNHYTSYASQDDRNIQYETRIGQVFDEIVTINTPIMIYDFLNITTSLNVSFELLKTTFTQNGIRKTIVLDKVDKTINLSRYVGQLSDSSPPSVGLSFNDRETSLYVKQSKDKKNFDGSNKTLRIYRKVIDEDLKSTYERLNVSNVDNTSFQEFQKYTYAHRSGENSIYRISFENSSEFEDVVFKSTGKKLSSKLIVIPRLIQTGIRVSIINNSLPEVIAAKLLYRDATIKNKNFSFSNQIATFNSNNSNNAITINNLTPYHVYEITTKLIFKNGVEVMSNYSSFLEYVPYSGDINSEISQLTVDKDVQFNINASLLPDQIGMINSLLSQTNTSYEVAALRDRPAEFDKFIAFSIIRYNLDRGHVDNLGIIANGETFVDSSRSLQVSAQQLIQGDRYKYVIYPLVRNPYDVINENVELRDQETRKMYKINPRKHHHPLTLIKGSVITKRFLDKNPKDDMLYGSIGTSIEVDIITPKNLPKIQNFIVSFLDKKRLILSWSLSGETTLVDHFILMKEINGVKSIIGKSHCFDDNLDFIHELTNHDLGNVRFVLNPIYQDYSSGASEASNYILINNLD